MRPDWPKLAWSGPENLDTFALVCVCVGGWVGGCMCVLCLYGIFLLEFKYLD